ncbi:hypothetical protein M91_09210 [Bos mutus]|uniref:Neurogenic mastermind-like N-terminal domain-containing protein n=1 Tax=Bos mutus TaxID=72004 RepID=L8IJN2_9CETA|nr:hypothetical protein M91_09210 [Bos mutus]
MGDFAAPAAAANGSSICINSSLNSSLGGAGIGVNNTPNSTPAAPYQQAQVEQLELERRDTVNLYQRTLEQRAKKSGAGTGKQQHQSKPQQDAEAASAEQRNHTLIMVRARWQRARGARMKAGGRVELLNKGARGSDLHGGRGGLKPKG